MDIFTAADALGPAMVVHITRTQPALRAIVVIDNVACGPAIGGARMAADATLGECRRLARAMTLKNAMAGLPHGGGKSVILADPAMPAADKSLLVRAFAAAIGPLADYIVGPDMGTDEQAMALVHDEIGRAVGLPRVLGGIPLDEIGATGRGLAAAAEAAAPVCGLALAGARVVVQGFGAVGYHAARFLAERGAVLVGASDSRVAVANPDGLDLAALAAHKDATGQLANYPGARTLAREAVLTLPCDILIPAARPDVIDAGNAGTLDCLLVLQGANIPATAEAEAILHRRGILSVPDFVANAGGVIAAAVEYQGGSESAAMARIAETVARNTQAVLDLAGREAIAPRAAADRIALARVREAMALRRWR